MNMLPFSYLETHQLMPRTGARLRLSSEGSGWMSLFASVQTEAKFSGVFSSVKDHLIVIPLNEPIRFKGRIGNNVQDCVLPPGSFSLTPGGADFELGTDNDQPDFDTIHLYLRHDLLAEIQSEMFGEAEGCMLAPCIGIMDPLIHSIASEIHKMLLNPSPSDAFYVETLARTLAGQLVRNHASGERPATPSPAELSPQQLSRAVQYIETHLAEHLSLSNIARAAGISTARLTRDFKKNTSCTPYDFVMRARVERARHLLVSTTLSLADIAVQCGFSDQQHMTHIVHRLAGSTPGAIRRKPKG